MTKPTKWHVRPANTQISLGICPVWSESSLCAQWVAKDPSFLHADSEDWSDWEDAQAIWVFAECTVILLVLSWGGSYFTKLVSIKIYLWALASSDCPLNPPSSLETWKNEPCHEKTCLWGLRPVKTQTVLLGYRDQLKSWIFGYSK